MARDPLKARVPPFRSLTDTNQMHNSVLNPPRMSEIGGADKLHKKGGPHRNKLSLAKPGGGTKSSY